MNILNLNKKAFTLIELIAVIIILSIISLMATAVILNVIEDSRKQAAIVSMNSYLDSVSQEYMQQKLTNESFDSEKYSGMYYVESDLITNLVSPDYSLIVAINGQKPSNSVSNFLEIDSNANVEEACILFQNYYVYYRDGKYAASKKNCGDAESDLNKGNNSSLGSCELGSIFLQVSSYENVESMPKNGQKNQIGLISSNLVTDYYIGMIQPTNVVEGMAWIKIGDIGDNKNSSLVSDRSQVPLVSCSQYINQNWETKECYVYNDEWHLISSSFSGDTEAPIITIDPGTITLTIDEVDGYDFMTGVSANDNISSPNNINIRIVQNTVKNTPGSYSIVYAAQDEAGNMSIAVRTVVVENNNFSISVNNVAGGTVNVVNTAKSGSVVEFTASTQNTDWDTYSYLGMNIKTMGGQILQTLSSNQFTFEMPEQNIILEPIIKLEKTYLVKSGQINKNRVIDSKASSYTLREDWASWNSNNWNPHTTGVHTQIVGNVDTTGAKAIYIDGSVSCSGCSYSCTVYATTSIGGTQLISTSSAYSKTISISKSGTQQLSITTQGYGRSVCAWCTNHGVWTHSLNNVYMTY